MTKRRNKEKADRVETEVWPVMGGAGLEPATPRTSSVCSTGLS
jgi:hypothetical protein